MALSSFSGEYQFLPPASSSLQNFVGPSQTRLQGSVSVLGLWETTEMNCLTILEARRPKARHQQVPVPCETCRLFLPPPASGAPGILWLVAVSLVSASIVTWPPHVFLKEHQLYRVRPLLTSAQPHLNSHSFNNPVYK